MASSTAGGVGATSNAQSGDSGIDIFDLASLRVSAEDVQRDGMMNSKLAASYWRKFCDVAGVDVNKGKIKLAVSCAQGTSAETDYSERLLESGNPKSSVQRLVDMLSTEVTLSKRINKLRVFCRSLEGFPGLTRQVIIANPWLARERANDYEMDVRQAGVCFDYADCLPKLGIELTPAELAAIRLGLRGKAGQGRSMQYNAENVGVAGSSPRERGVAEAIVPDSSRVTGRGSGPFGRGL